MRRLILFPIPLLLFLTSCVDVGYYAQCARGHLGVMKSCRPIPEVIRDEQTSDELRQKLQTVQRIRTFAVRQLGLPDNGSYRSYGDLGRPYAVWNVVAAGEFSLEPKRWCFPVAGCVSYRGYFSRHDARSFAEKLRAKGFDVHVYGVDAYSTLNWFDDPVLNTFLDRSEADLAGLIFHELSHQMVYAANDSRFNEGFATTVELEGVRRWFSSTGRKEMLTRFEAALGRQSQFVALLQQVRAELQTLYSSDMEDARRRQAKAKILEASLEDYRELKRAWGGFGGYDDFFAGGLSNAKLVSVGTYQDLVPAFRNLLARLDNNLTDFYREAARLANLPHQQRLSSLTEGDRIAQSRPVMDEVAD